jgi:hypothetical protein
MKLYWKFDILLLFTNSLILNIVELIILQVKCVIDNMASMYAWTMRQKDSILSWADKFVVFFNMGSKSMKSTFSLDTDYFNDELVDRVSRLVY